MEELISQITETKKHLAEQTQTKEHEDAIAMCDHLVWALNETDDALRSTQLLQQLRGPVQQVFNNRGTPSHVVSNILQVLRLAPLPLNEKRRKPESNKMLENLKAGIEQTKHELDELVDELKEKIAAQESDLLAQSSELSGIKSRLTDQSGRLDNLVETAQTSFDQKRSEIIAHNDEQLSALRKDLDDLRSNQETQFKTNLRRLEGYLDNTYDEVQTKLAELDTLLGLAGEKSLIADYSKIANDEGKNAFSWSLAAIAILVCGIGIACAIVWFYKMPDTLTIPALLSRIALPFSVFVPGFYCAAKAKGHRDTQIRARNTGVRLSTLEPFLTNLREDQRDEIRAKLVEEFFVSKTNVSEKVPLIGMSPKSTVELIREMKS